MKNTFGIQNKFSVDANVTITTTVVPKIRINLFHEKYFIILYNLINFISLTYKGTYY